MLLYNLAGNHIPNESDFYSDRDTPQARTKLKDLGGGKSKD